MKKTSTFRITFDPLLSQHMELIKKEVHKIVEPLGDESPGLMLHGAKEAAGDIIVFTVYIQGEMVIVVHPITEAAVIEAAFKSLLPGLPGSWLEVNSTN